MKPRICTDVCDPLFDEKNKPYGYDASFDYVGAAIFAKRLNLAVERHWFGADLNRAAWLHDLAWEDKSGWWASNRIFRQNVTKLIQAQHHNWAAHVLAWSMWAGVASPFALMNYWWC